MRIIEQQLGLAEQKVFGHQISSGEELLDLVHELGPILREEPGRPEVLVLRTDPDRSDEEIRAMGRSLSSSVGSLLPQDSQGALERDVIERPVIDRPARFSESRDAAPMHTDGMHMPDQPVPDYFSLSCLHAAKIGGDLSFVHLDDLMASFDDREMAESILKKEFWFHTKGVDPRGRHHVRRPILESASGGTLKIQYAREYVDLGHALPDAPSLDNETVGVLDELDEILARPRLHEHYRLERGDIALIDNRRVLHSRTAFENEEGRPSRCMMRLWIAGA